MAKTIWKYEIDPKAISDKTRFLTLKLPKKASFLTANTLPSFKNPFMWFEVDPAAEKEDRIFEIVATGGEIRHKIGTYLGTVFIDMSEMLITYVFHIYEVLMP